MKGLIFSSIFFFSCQIVLCQSTQNLGKGKNYKFNKIDNFFNNYKKEFVEIQFNFGNATIKTFPDRYDYSLNLSTYDKNIDAGYKKIQTFYEKQSKFDSYSFSVTKNKNYDRFVLNSGFSYNYQNLKYISTSIYQPEYISFNSYGNYDYNYFDSTSFNQTIHSFSFINSFGFQMFKPTNRFNIVPTFSILLSAFFYSIKKDYFEKVYFHSFLPNEDEVLIDTSKIYFTRKSPPDRRLFEPIVGLNFTYQVNNNCILKLKYNYHLVNRRVFVDYFTAIKIKHNFGFSIVRFLK